MKRGSKKNSYPGVIYLYINKINGKKYVGQAVDFKRRHYTHIHGKRGLYIDNAIQKYGIENFKIVFLEAFCCSDQKKRDKKLDELEKYWIKKLHTYWYEYPDQGYNLTCGGDGVHGYRKPGAKIYRADFDTKEEFEKARYAIRKDKMHEYQIKYRQEHKEELKLKDKERRIKNHEAILIRERERYAKNKNNKTEKQKEQARECSKRYRERHKEKVKAYRDAYNKKRWSEMSEEEKRKRAEYCKQWRIKNKEKVKEYAKQRKKRKLQTKI